MITDWRILCVELVRIADALDGGTRLISNQGQALDGYSALAAFRAVADHARAALAEPEPESPTDEELLELMPQAMRDDLASVSRLSGAQIGLAAGVFRTTLNVRALDYARAVLARWGTPNLAEVRRSLDNAPVPVTERLPGPEDCDADGECWWWHPSHPESGYLEGWMMRPRVWGVGHYDLDDRPTHTHWLPARALPLPLPEVSNG